MTQRKEFGRIPVELIEIDQPRCALNYGTGTCTAVIGDSTGRQVGPQADISQKCFNTIGTCQDVDNYAGDKVDYWLSLDSADSYSWSPVTPNTYIGWVTIDFFINFSGPENIAAESVFTWGPIDFRIGTAVGGLPFVEVYISGTLVDEVTPLNRVVFSYNTGSGAYRIKNWILGNYEVGGTTITGPISATSVSIDGHSQITPVNFSDIKIYNALIEVASRDRLNRTEIGPDNAIFHAPLLEFNGILNGDVITGVNQGVQTFKSSVLPLNSPPLILRFTKQNQAGSAESVSAIPSLQKASTNPARINPGGVDENVSPFGKRATLSASIQDHPDSDIFTDPYVSERTYSPREQGTFWGKWMARNEFRQGIPVRFRSGYLTVNGFEDHQTYNYILDKVNGPSSNGAVSVECFDLLKKLDARNAVFPSTSPGSLEADISDTATSFTLQPAGVGSEYSTSFRCRIGGEGFDVSRSGDTCTINTRGLYGGPESHEQDDTVQEVAQMSGQVHDVAFDIIVGALPDIEQNIPKAEWDALANDFLPRVYSADITEPTGVEDLLTELSQAAPVYWYADVRTNLIEMGVIRDSAAGGVELTEDNHFIAGSMSKKEYPKERVDEVWIYYRIRDAAGKIDDDKNFSRRYILVNPEEQNLRGRRSIKRVYTRWVTNVDAAGELAQSYISRFSVTPVRINFDLDAKDAEIWVGDVIRPRTRLIQDISGNDRVLNYQVLEAEEKRAGTEYSYMAQSYEFFDPVDPDFITITIVPEDTVDSTGEVQQIDLRQLYDSVVATEIPNITFVVGGGPGNTGGTVVGAGAGQGNSLILPNSWPWNPDIDIRIEEGGAVVGRQGAGGDGADADSSPYPSGSPGANGLTALQVRYNVTLNNLGIIGGGGGGAGGGGVGSYREDSGDGVIEIALAGGGGGSGAGRRLEAGGEGGTKSSANNTGGFNGNPGTFTDGGDGGSGAEFLPGAGDGGTGGALGQPGAKGQDGTAGGPDPGAIASSGGAGGNPGAAVDGVSYITYTYKGDIRGAEIN